MKKLALLLGAAIAAAALLVPAAMAKEIGSGGTVTPPAPAPVAAPCATVSSLAAKASKAGGEPEFGFEIRGDYAVTSCSSNTESVTVQVNFSKVVGATLLQSYEDQTVTLLAGKGSRGSLYFGGLPQRTSFKIEIVVTDTATGAVLAVRSISAGTPASKV